MLFLHLSERHFCQYTLPNGESTGKDDELTIEHVEIDRPPKISPLRHQGYVPPVERETSFCRPERLQC